jgi:hypothetical protein
VCREHIRRRERAREQAMIGQERRQVRAFRICLALTNSKCVSRNPTPRPVVELKRPTMETPLKPGKMSSCRCRWGPPVLWMLLFR